MSHITVRHFTWLLSEKRGRYETLIVEAGRRKVEVTVSPTGRSVHVLVDGKEVGREQP